MVHQNGGVDVDTLMETLGYTRSLLRGALGDIGSLCRHRRLPDNVYADVTPPPGDLSPNARASQRSPQTRLAFRIAGGAN